MGKPVFRFGFTYPVQNCSQRFSQGVAGASLRGAQAGFELAKYCVKSNRIVCADILHNVLEPQTQRLLGFVVRRREPVVLEA